MNKEQLSELVSRQVEAINNIPIESPIIDAVELIYEHVHQRNGKVIVCGMGKAGHIGYNFSMTLSSTGTAAIFLHPGEAQHGDLGMIQKDDLLFVISNSGKTREILELIQLSKKLHPNIKIIGLTGHPDADLNTLTDVLMFTGNPEEICPLGLTPTTSSVVLMVVLNLIVVSMMDKIGFTKEDYAKRHHSGYLGKIAKEDG